jgi:hypothetical protein
VLVLCCGSRGYSDERRVREVLAALPADTRVIHGAARGADRIAAAVAESLGFAVRGYPADWKAEPRRAGYIRNALMLDQEPELVIAFWDRRSPGTAHTIREAEKRGIEVRIVGQADG